jgi:glycosyltransferase involved in cell wall biosynthesis
VDANSKDGLKISVVIPTHQRPLLLLRCLEGLLRQDFPKEDFEIIIVSDGHDPSTSHSLAALPDKIFPRIRYYSLPVKGGPAAARNMGWMLAQSELIAFTDDDCIPNAGWLNAIWSSYEERGKEEIAFSGKTIVPIQTIPTDYERNMARLAAAEFITANCASTKKALHRVGGFDERFKMAWREDSDLQFKFIMQAIPIVKVENAVVTHPVRKASWGVCIKEERKGMFNALLYKKYPKLYKEKIQPNPPWHYYTIAFFLLLFLAGLLTSNASFTVAGLVGWLLMTAWFTWKRLNSTSRSWHHVSEMIFTSALIPLISLFWKFYGSWKYKVLLVP